MWITGTGWFGYVAQLEKRIEEKDMVIGLLRDELVQRNEEIVRRNERERETNILIGVFRTSCRSSSQAGHAPLTFSTTTR